MDDVTTDTISPLQSSASLLARLSAMMFLQYWPLGTWGVTFGSYIAANTGPRGSHFFSSGFVAAERPAPWQSPLPGPHRLSQRSIRGRPAPRYAHARGVALAAWQMSQTQSQTAFYLWLLVYYQCFSPACALTNKIADSPSGRFPRRISSRPAIRHDRLDRCRYIRRSVWPTFAGESIEMTASPL